MNLKYHFLSVLLCFAVACKKLRDNPQNNNLTVAQNLPAETWGVTRKIPLPDQASKMMQNFIVKTGQPDIEAAAGRLFPNQDARKSFIDQSDQRATKVARQLARQLDIDVEKTTLAGVTVRNITPKTISPDYKDKIFIHLHGGAYILNGGEAGITEALMIAHYVSIPVISIDYRMPPKYPYPSAVNDVSKVYQELLKEYTQKSIAIGGTSTGGGLVMASIHNFKTEKLTLPGAVFLGTPWADINKIGDSYFLNEGIDQLLVCYEGVLQGAANLYAGEYDKKDPLISPIYGEFGGFPPTYLVSGTRDLFLSNTIRTHRKLKEAGVIADLNIYEGISHGQYLLVFDSEENRQVFSELGNFLLKHLR